MENDLKELEELAQMVLSESYTEKDKIEIKEKLKETEKEISALDFQLLFSGKYDKNDAIVSIRSGAGGVDAQDWAEMLLRMYLRFSEKNKFKAKIVEESRGQEAGIKSVTFEISGSYAYGNLRSESGVHRLVRLSPFNADHLRQTSFAQVEVLPVIEDPAELEINPKDIRFDVYRSSGPGGQGVNTTDSAVRITHIPTGIMVACQNERSQLQNREEAMKILRSKLHQLRLEKQEEEKEKLKGEKKSAEWGNQARSYVIHPYKLIKDHRTKYETSNVEDVFNGNISAFVEAYLRNTEK